MSDDSTGAKLIAAERARQIAKGYTREHDDALEFCALRQAARTYAMEPTERVQLMPNGTPKPWPWGPEQWKPSPDRVRELTRAGALYLADAERCERGADREAGRLLRLKAAWCAAQINGLLTEHAPGTK